MSDGKIKGFLSDAYDDDERHYCPNCRRYYNCITPVRTSELDCVKRSPIDTCLPCSVGPEFAHTYVQYISYLDEDDTNPVDGWW